MMTIEDMRRRVRWADAIAWECIGSFEPDHCHWLTSDASASYCFDHAIEARATETPKPEGLHDAWWTITREQREAKDAFLEGINGPSWGESDVVEHCSTCGIVLQCLLTDYGQREELDAYAQGGGFRPTLGLRPDSAYEITRALMNLDQSDDEQLLRDAMACCDFVFASMSYTY